MVAWEQTGEVARAVATRCMDAAAVAAGVADRLESARLVEGGVLVVRLVALVVGLVGL